MNWLTIVILTFNEEQNIKGIIDNVLALYQSTDVEIIVSDGSSTDRTRALIYDNIKVVVAESNRSKQMAKAVEAASGNVLWFLHADMILPLDALVQIKEVLSLGYDGGGFTNVFDSHNAKIKRIGMIMNLRFFDQREQSDKGIFYGDNGIFVKRKELKNIGGVPQQEIMEDYELSLRLKKIGCKLFKIPKTPIIVSSRRHVEDGFVRTRLKWIIIRKLYKIGVKPNLLRKLYGDKRSN